VSKLSFSDHIVLRSEFQTLATMTISLPDSYRSSTVLWPAPSASGEEPVAWVPLFGLVTIGTILRVVSLNQQLWFDEILTLLDSARQPVLRTITHYGGQNQHILYSVLAHGSIRLFGEQPWTLRLPAVFFGVASIPTLYFFGRLVTTNREALLASALVTINYQHVWFSQNARGYTGIAFWTLLTSIFFIRSATNGKRSDWILYGVAAALGIYTHLMMVCVVVGQALLYVLLLGSKGSSNWYTSRNCVSLLYGFILCGFLSLLLYAPVIPSVLAHTIVVAGDPSHYQWTSPFWAVREVVRSLRGGILGGLLAITLVGVILLSGFIAYCQENRFAVGLMILPGLITAMSLLATHHNFWPRFFFFEIGFALLLVVRGAMVLGKLGAQMLGRPDKLGLKAGTALVLLILLASVVPLRAEYRYPKQDYLGAMKFLDEHQQPGEQVMTAGSLSTPYQRYYHRNWPLVQTHAQFESALRSDHATWIVYSMPNSIRISQPEVWAIIEKNFTLVRAFSGTLGGGTIYVSKSNEHSKRDSHVQ